MKTAISQLVRRLPRPMFLTAGFLGLGMLSTIAATLVPFERFGARDTEVPIALRFDEELESAVAEDLISISFSLPATLPSTDAGAALTLRAEVDPDLVLRAIAQVESQGNPRRVGRLGERGMYQFRRETWRQHTAEDFRRAHHPEISTTVARRHYDWIARELRARGFEASPYEVAIAWNAGLSRVISGKVPSRTRHYAQRVANLAADS